MDGASLILGGVGIIMGVATSVMIYMIPKMTSLEKEWQNFKKKDLEDMKSKISKLDERTELILRYIEFMNGKKLAGE